MSGNLSRLKFASVEPPPFAWDRIERRLNAHKVPEDITYFSQLRDCSVSPPADLKDRLFEALDSLPPINHATYQTRKKRVNSISFPRIEKLTQKRKVYWGMAGFIIVSVLIFSYLILGNSWLSEAESSSAKSPKKNEQGSFTPPSVSDKNAGELSF